MSQNEKNNFKSNESFNDKALEELRNERFEKINENLERSAETERTSHESEARHEALERASSIEKEARNKPEAETKLEKRRPATKHERKASYNKVMDEVKAQLPAPSRAFSNFIHQPAIEKLSDAVGGTIARPNAILAGSVFAFALTLAVYLVARLYGYPLSGSESIASFTLGWVIGIIFDYIRLLVGRRSN
ncbi:MAG: hypothetical protein ABI397_00175 [Candidatus Saccharimonas sp.]